MCGYAIAPSTVPVMLALPTMVFTTIGTALCVGSANAFNQWIEQPFDAQMTRTRTRVLVRRAMSSAHALGFGIASGVGGVAILHTLVNPTVAALGAANIVLYSGVYTYMKRTSIYNTWVGSVVGAIPPLMGWAASTGGTLDFPAAFVVAAVLYSWQFPHFNALSWNLRADYAKAGYHMMCVTDPKLNATVALRHAVALVPIAWLMPVLSITTPWFAITSLVPNGLLIAGAYRFYRKSDEKTARSLMFGSLVHLPLFLTLMLLHKRSDDTADMGALISIFGQSAADIIAEAKKHNPSS
ncbi:protoheme IX farnesyltransferase [Ramicandelaber brevisporus]|nr:protoheme IX farnesyltransferase [Ramicandelaber brevisporus]